MFSVFIRLAFTAALVTVAIFVASFWQSYWQRQLGLELTNLLVVGGLIFLGGLAAGVWTYGTRVFGFALRAVLSVPLAGFVVFIVMWVQPFYLRPLLGTAFFMAMIVACVLLIAAIWSYWPKKP